jgi:hypothetical protein
VSYKSKTAVSEVVALPSGYSATIHALRKADNDALQTILLGSAKQRGTTTIAGNSQSTVIDQETDSAAYTTAVILKGVSTDERGQPLWDLDEEDGSISPLTAATVAALTSADANTLVKAITALSEPPDKSGTSARQSLTLVDPTPQPATGTGD